MAFYCRMKLPPLKLTKRPVGSKSTSVVHRGITTSSDESISRQDCDVSCLEDPEVEAPMYSPDSLTTDEPTHHELQCKSDVKGWEQLRSQFLSVATECSAMPQGALCVFCPSPAEFRCQECGSSIFFCEHCFCMHHEKSNFFHVAEKWEGDHYVIADLPIRRINVQPHPCDTTRTILLHCLDEHGMEHSIHFVCCSCEPIAVTLVRAQLWPATPHYPRFAFTFKLLDWAESLLLECQVALKDFCHALYFRCPYSIKQRRDVYTSMIDAFEEYRFFKNEQRHLCYLSKALDRGNICPACPKEDGKIVYAIDGLFGLPRKKAAGVSYREALQGDLFFLDQEGVDEFVEKSSNAKSIPTECSDFLAGNPIRSSTRFRALDETALYGASCRHEFPTLFCNLKHGERLSYAVYLIEELVKMHKNAELFIIYDVACTLKKHLKHCRRDDLLERISLCLPTFHSYGHRASCQISLGPLRCVGVGLSDGEVMERLWSYLRRFSRMTKEMRPAHRVDVLVHALLYWGMQKKDRLCKQLVMRWHRAHDIKCAADETFHSLVTSWRGVNLTEVIVKKWVDEESVLGADVKFNISHLPSWKCEYFQTLHFHYQLRERLNSGLVADNEKQAAYHEIVRLDKQLKDLEAKHHLPCRWNPTDREYTKVQSTLSLERRNGVGEAMWTASSRRQYLLKSKAKYADGQKIAKKLSIQISRETRKIKEFLPEFNACQNMIGESEILLEDALNPSKLTSIMQLNVDQSKQELTDSKRELINSYLTMKRADEELSMLTAEMSNTIHHYEREVGIVQKCIEQYSNEVDAFSKGAVALLQAHLIRLQAQVKESCELFSPICMNDSSTTITDTNFELDEDTSDSSDEENLSIPL